MTAKSIKVICIGDPHFKSDNKTQTDLMVNQVVELITRERPQMVVILGDILHTHERLSLHCLKRANDFFVCIYRTLMALDETNHLYILIGNHDRPNDKVFMTDEHPFNAVKEWSKNVTVVDTTMVGVHAGFNFAFVPYVSPGRFGEALEAVSLKPPYSTISGIFAHQEFKGAKMNSITSNEGDEYDLSWPMCISGHIHDYDDLQSNLIYTGTPIQHGFADRGNKTISMFTFEGLEGASRMVVTSHNRIQLNIPKKLNLHLSPEELLEYKHDGFSNVKITLHGDPMLIRQVLATTHTADLVKSGVKFKEGVSKRGTEVTKPAETRLKVPFSRRLVDMLATKSPGMQASFYHLFPNAPKIEQK